MNIFEQALPDSVRSEFFSDRADPPQNEIVRTAVAHLQAGSSVAVVVPATLLRVCVAQGVMFELATANAQKRPTILVLVPSEVAIEQYVQDSTWLQVRLSLGRVAKPTPRFTPSLKQQLADSHVLLSTPEYLLAHLRRNSQMFSELEALQLVVIDEVSDSAKADKSRDEVQELLKAVLSRVGLFLYLTTDSSTVHSQKLWDTTGVPPVW